MDRFLERMGEVVETGVIGFAAVMTLCLLLL